MKSGWLRRLPGHQRPARHPDPASSSSSASLFERDPELVSWMGGIIPTWPTGGGGMDVTAGDTGVRHALIRTDAFRPPKCRHLTLDSLLLAVSVDELIRHLYVH